MRVRDRVFIHNVHAYWFSLPNGESGIVRTLESPIYVTHVKGRTMYALNREWEPLQLEIDNTEYQFKLSLEAKNYREVARIIKSDKLVGEAIIAYLLKNDFAEGALEFKQDPITKVCVRFLPRHVFTCCWQGFFTPFFSAGLSCKPKQCRC